MQFPGVAWPTVRVPLEIREVGADERADAVAQARRALDSPPEPDELEQRVAVLAEGRMVGAFTAEGRIATAASYDLDLVVPGGHELPVIGVTMISVDASMRGFGVMRRLVDRLLDDALQAGRAGAVLWSAIGDGYRSLGFGPATDVLRLERSERGSPSPLAAPVSVVELIDIEVVLGHLPPIYDAVARDTPGMLARTGLWWRDHSLRGFATGALHAHVAGDGGDRGYMVTRRRGETLELAELFGLDADAEAALAAQLLADSTGRLRAERLPAGERWPRRVFPVEDLAEARGLWLRILDVEAALRARAFADVGMVTLELTDEDLEMKSSPWRIEVRRGSVVVERGKGADPVRLDGSALAERYLDRVTIGQLAEEGRAEGSEMAIEQADCVFGPARRPFCAELF
jgi:predicted acetyltransferase